MIRMPLAELKKMLCLPNGVEIVGCSGVSFDNSGPFISFEATGIADTLKDVRPRYKHFKTGEAIFDHWESL